MLDLFSVDVGAIHKNTKHHPDMTFLVKSVKRVNGRPRRVGGICVRRGRMTEETYDASEFRKSFPFVMWVPPGT